MEENGQIHLNTKFGYMLYTLASDTQYKTYLEVGTWKGNGSTKCVMEGLIERYEANPEDTAMFHSFEANATFFKEATDLWSPKGYTFLKIHHAKLHENGLMTREEIEQHPLFEDVIGHFELWYDQDVKDYAEAPYINPETLVKNVDILILDGGEFSGYADWLALKSLNPKIVCLDDSGCMKNKKVYEELAADSQWKLWQEGGDRNGWAIFSKI